MKQVFHRLLPQSCFLCGYPQANRALCDACLHQLPKISNPCFRCGLPLPSPGSCGACLAAPPPFQRTFCLWQYRWPTDVLIQGFKFHARFELLPLFANQLASRIQQSGPPYPTALVPVPLSSERLKERGFNQSRLLANSLTSLLPNHPEHIHVGRRHQETHQTDLPAKHRMNNLKNAFYLTHATNHHHVAIVDDVITTTATIKSLAQLLTNSGIQQIDVWAIARTPNIKKGIS